jgi:hypothetical protein
VTHERPTRTLIVPCRIGGEPGRFRLHLGLPARGFGAAHFQAAWLKETRGGTIEPEVLTALGGRADERDA